VDRSTARRQRRPLFIVLAAMAVALWATPVLATRVPTDPEPDIACHGDYGTGWLTAYATTVETPADSTDWWISVEFTIAGDGASCELSLATYELPSAEFTYPQALYDSQSGTFGPGTHTLTAALPTEGALDGCWSQYDFVFGPVIEELTFENRYADRQIRARIVGSESCDVAAVPTATPTPTPSSSVAEGTPTPTPMPAVATPTPREDTQGGNPTPAAGQGGLPDTSVPMTSTGTIAGLFGLVLLGAVGMLAFATARSRTRR
jgi:hypothetical protein